METYSARANVSKRDLGTPASLDRKPNRRLIETEAVAGSDAYQSRGYFIQTREENIGRNCRW